VEEKKEFPTSSEVEGFVDAFCRPKGAEDVIWDPKTRVGYLAPGTECLRKMDHLDQVQNGPCDLDVVKNELLFLAHVAQSVHSNFDLKSYGSGEGDSSLIIASSMSGSRLPHTFFVPCQFILALSLEELKDARSSTRGMG
jgi:hypothetical protein